MSSYAGVRRLLTRSMRRCVVRWGWPVLTLGTVYTLYIIATEPERKHPNVLVQEQLPPPRQEEVSGYGNITDAAIQKTETFNSTDSQMRRLGYVQTQRQKLLVNGCQKHGLYAPQEVASPPFFNALSFKELKLAVCQIPKAGSSFWKNIISKKYKSVTAQSNYEGTTLEWKTYYRAVFVRHPLYRLYSAYNDKVVGLQRSYIKYIKPGIDKVRKGSKQDYSPCLEDVTFEEFVKMVIMQVKSDPYTVDVHWSPYYGLCKTCRIKYDFIGKIETFQDDLDFLISESHRRNISLEVEDLDRRSAYLHDKCRQMDRMYLKPFYGADRKCYNQTAILKSKLRSLWNKGFSERFGFTMENFTSVSKEKWHDTCYSLGRQVLQSEAKRREAREASRRAAMEALRQLTNQTLEQLILAFAPDFDMFGYNPGEPFSHL